jgi:hypothetical protein
LFCCGWIDGLSKEGPLKLEAPLFWLSDRNLSAAALLATLYQFFTKYALVSLYPFEKDLEIIL